MGSRNSDRTFSIALASLFLAVLFFSVTVEAAATNPARKLDKAKLTVPAKLVHALLNLSKAARDIGAVAPAVRVAGSPASTSAAGAPAFAWAVNEAVPAMPAAEALKVV